MLGSLSSGWIIALGGFRLAFEINAVTYAVAGALILGLRFTAGGMRAAAARARAIRRAGPPRPCARRWRRRRRWRSCSS